VAVTRKLDNLIFAVVLVVTLFVGVTPPVLADQDSNEGSFSAYVFKDGDWQLRGVLHFSDYETLHMQLGNYTGQLKLRLVQEGHDAAYIDQVIVQKYGISYLPTSAINIDDNTDVLTKILYPEYDVCNGWGSTLEVAWDNAPENATLVMRAMEEDIGEVHGSPMYYPWPYEHRTLSQLLVNDGGITVDGVLEESRKPDFSVFWQPYSPHPDGYTYGWIHCDGEFLYAAVEVTADNTPDADDWGALYIMVDGKPKEFRVSQDQTWGVRGFQYTSSVPYEHRVYEFKIPLSTINAAAGSEILYIFGAYGTVATATLVFDTVPANTGRIYFDGNTYSDGNSTTLPGSGTYVIEAVPAPGYVFVEWQVEGGISVDVPNSSVANLSIINIVDSTLRMVQTVPRLTESVNTTTGTGTATFSTSNGSITGLTATAATQCGNLSGFAFPHGFFSFNIIHITPGSTVTITIILPTNMPTNTQYWKCQNGTWTDCTPLLGDDDGDNILTLTITDGGLGDADGAANGTIVDPGGPAVTAATTIIRTNPRSSPMPPNQLKLDQFSVQYLSINPHQAAANQPITITTNAVNNGDEAGNVNVTLKINGQIEQTRMVSVGPRATQPVKFTITKAESGTYDVDVGGQTGSFTILGAGSRTTSTSSNGGLIIIVIVGMIILSTVVVLIFISSRNA
jgi:hypothetical protein